MLLHSVSCNNQAKSWITRLNVKPISIMMLSIYLSNMDVRCCEKIQITFTENRTKPTNIKIKAYEGSSTSLKSYSRKFVK